MASPARLLPLSARRPTTAALAAAPGRLATGRRWLAATRARRSEGDDRPRRSFVGQMYESTAQRVLRSREDEVARVAKAEAEEARYSRHGLREGRVSGDSLAYVFGLGIVGGIAYWLGQSSMPTLPTTSTSPLSSITPPKHDAFKGNLEASWADFVALLGAENVSTNTDDLARHSTSDWSSYHPPASPSSPSTTTPSSSSTGDKPLFMVLYPSTTAEVSGICKICHDRRIPITAFAGGTSLEGHFAPTRGGVCVDFSRMNRVVAVHAADLDVVVQPAVGWEQLNDELAGAGLFFPPDPGPGAMIGGMVGTGCSGTNAARYGTMREWVLALTVVLADGTVVRTRQRPRKSSAGYDLTRLLVGSEGTLGLVTEATLRLAVKPPHEAVAVCTFPTVRAAAEAVAAITKRGVPLAAVELLDDVQMRCINASGSTSRAWREAPSLFLKFAGTPAGVKETVALVKDIARAHAAGSFEFASSPAEARELWSARKEALWSVIALKRRETDRVWTTDVAVPLSRLPDIVDATKSDIKASGLLGAIVGHVGDGNFHSIILFGEEEQAVAEAVVHRMVQRAIEMEGTVTGEHGVGLIKRDYLAEELGPEAVDMMRRLKLALDPLCILNCDKVVRVAPPGPGEQTHH